MNKFFFLTTFIFITSCIGPVKELERQINDVYFDDVVDFTPEPLPEAFDNQIKVNQVWDKAFEDLPLNSEIVFNDEFIYLISEEGTFYKISQESSDVIFSKKLDVTVKRGLFFNKNNNNYFYFIEKNNFLTKIDTKGNHIWKIKLPYSTNLKPYFYNNQVIFKFINNNIISIDDVSGLELWAYNRKNPPLSVNIQSPLLLEDSILYTGYPGGKVVIIDPESGSFITELTLSRPKGSTDIDRTNDVSGKLSVVKNMLFAASYNGEIAAFDRSSGAKMWSRKSSSFHGVVSDQINLILVHENDSIYNFDITTGKTIWKNSDLAHRKISMPIIYNDYIFTVDYLGVLHIFNLTEGERVAIHKFGKDFESLINFGESTSIRNTLNITKIYIVQNFVYIFINNKEIIKVQIDE